MIPSYGGLGIMKTNTFLTPCRRLYFCKIFNPGNYNYTTNKLQTKNFFPNLFVTPAVLNTLYNNSPIISLSNLTNVMPAYSKAI